MAKSPFGSLADLIAQLGVQPEQPKPQEPGVETPKPQDPDKPKPEVPQSDLGKVFDKKATFTLTKEERSFTGANGKEAKDDVIDADVVAFAHTLRADSKIDGGEGNDTLKINLQSNFSGLDEGEIKNIETIALSNEASSAKEFSAKNVKGVKEYIMKGAVELSDLAEIPTSISYLDKKEGTIKVGFAKDSNGKIAATQGKTDELTLNIHALGKEAAKEDEDPTRATIDFAGIENVNLNASGDNFITSDLAGLKKLVVNGEGVLNLDLGTAKTTIETIDASAFKGKFVGELDGATSLKSAVLGAGDDEVVANITNLSRATLDGGKGEDTLEVKAAATSILKAKGFETIKFGNVGSDATIMVRELDGVNNIVVSDEYNRDVKLEGLGARNVDVALEGENGNNKSISLAHAGATTLVVRDPKAEATATAPTTNDVDFTARSTKSLELTVAEKMKYTGDITVNNASSIDATIEGAMNNAINAAKATSISIKNGASKSTIALKTPKATSLSITSKDALDLAGSTLSAVKSLDITADKGEVGKNALDLVALSSASFKGAGEGEVAFKNLGSAALASAMEIKAESLKKLTLGTLTTKAKTIDVITNNISSDVTVGAISSVDGTKYGSVSLKADNVLGAVSYANAANINAGDFTAKLTSVLGDVTFGALQNAKDVTISVDTLGKATMGAITATGEVKLDLESVLGRVKLGTITAHEKATIKGSLTQMLNDTEQDGVAADNVDIVLTGVNATAKLYGGVAVDKATIKLGTADGDKKLTVQGDLSTGANELVVDAVTTNTGKATIDLSGFEAGASGTVTVKTVAGKDDAIKLGNSKEIVVLTGNTAADTITGFKAGAEGDKLNVQNFTDAVTVTQVAGRSPLVKDTVNVFTHNANIKGKDFGGANFAEVFKAEGITTTNSGTAYAADDKAVVLVVGKDQTHVYKWVAADATIDAAEVTLIGILEGDYKAADFIAGNFVIA